MKYFGHEIEWTTTQGLKNLDQDADAVFRHRKYKIGESKQY